MVTTVPSEKPCLINAPKKKKTTTNKQTNNANQSYKTSVCACFFFCKSKIKRPPSLFEMGKPRRKGPPRAGGGAARRRGWRRQSQPTARGKSTSIPTGDTPYGDDEQPDDPARANDPTHPFRVRESDFEIKREPLHTHGIESITQEQREKTSK